MKVKWTDEISASALERIWEMYPEANGQDFDKDYEGEVIGTDMNIWGTTFLIVACTDGKIRKCDIYKAQQIKE